jgi:hypothetical protein
MKKQLNVDLVQNELRGGSAFFPGYQGSGLEAPATPLSPALEPKIKPVLAPKPPARRAQAVKEITVSPIPVSREKRLLIRRTFDLYEDQLDYLTKESLQERLAGKEGSMNAMVRSAIDEWIEKHHAAK